MVTMCSTCRASFICYTVNHVLIRRRFSCPNLFQQSSQDRRITSQHAAHPLRTNCKNVFYFPLLPNCSSGSKDVAVSQLHGSPLKSRELGGGYYFSDDMEHILWPKPMAPRAINGLLICKRHFHWPPVRPGPFDLRAWLGTSESHYFLFLGGSCSFFHCAFQVSQAGKYLGDLREPI